MNEEETDAVDAMPLVLGNGSPEIVHMPLVVQRVEPQTTTLHVLDDEQLRTMIREEVHRTLYPAAELANPHEHRRIEMTEQDGRKWRGVLYLVEQDEES